LLAKSSATDYDTAWINSPTAAGVPSTPSGNLAASNVQAALNELQTDIDTRALASSAPGYAFKNAVMNGAFEVWQRGTSFAAPSSATYCADRWRYGKASSVAVHTVSRSTDVPTTAQAGLLVPYSMLVDCTTADTSTEASDVIYMAQRVEGYFWRNYAQRALTLSFWVKATKTGVYCVGLINNTGDRSIALEYTVNAADTWERKTISIPASPSAGTWDYAAGVGAQLLWVLQAGNAYHITPGAWQSAVTSGLASTNQVNACDSTANDFRLALVQLELGTAATDFAPVPFEVELARCQRYYEKTFDYDVAPATNAGVNGAHFTTTQVAGGVGNQFPHHPRFCVRKRTAPSVAVYNPSAANNFLRNYTNSTNSSTVTVANISQAGCTVTCVGDGTWALNQTVGYHWTADAEL